MVGLCNGQLGLRLRQLSGGQLVLKLHEQLAFAYALSVVEQNLFDTAPHLRAQHHTLTRAQTAHGLGFVHQRHGFDFGHFDRRRTGTASGCRLRGLV